MHKSQEELSAWFVEHRAGVEQTCEHYIARLVNGEEEFDEQDRQTMIQLLVLFREVIGAVDWPDVLEDMWRLQRRSES